MHRRSNAAGTFATGLLGDDLLPARLPRVRFVTAAELVALLVEAQQQGRLARKLAQLACFDVVIAGLVVCHGNEFYG